MFEFESFCPATQIFPRWNFPRWGNFGLSPRHRTHHSALSSNRRSPRNKSSIVKNSKNFGSWKANLQSGKCFINASTDACTELNALNIRVANLAFLTPNWTNLAFFRGLWRQKFCLAFWLFFLLNLAFFFEAIDLSYNCLSLRYFCAKLQHF